MAIISANTFFDGSARTAGETWYINSGAVLTVRTDTRIHANASAGNTGTIGSTIINDGEILFDGRNVRWMPFDSGTGNVPSIGTTISQGGVSGYLLGVWENYTSSPKTVGTAMPTSGYLKFREVSGGSFTSGSLTGIGASATSPDVLGWIEIVSDQGANHTTVTAFSKYTVRGGKFFLENTNGVVGQTIQFPTNGSTTTYPHGFFVETEPSSEEYEFWPSVNGATGGWAYNHAAAPRDETDKRQRCVKVLNTGALQFGEYANVSGTYASTAALSGTPYSSWQFATMQYWTEGNDCFIYNSAIFNSLITGDIIHFDFTSGLGTSYDGYYEITVINASLIKITLPVSLDTKGNVTLRLGINITAFAHGLFVGDDLYVLVATGAGFPSGNYKIRQTGTNNIYVMFQHSGTITTGTCSVYWGTTITTASAHGLLVGNKLKCDFTTGTGVDGNYFVYTVPTTTTMVINVPFYGGTGGNVTMAFSIGHVPPSGCRIWIPNVIFRQCVTTTRYLNAIPHATVAIRPEFVTTSTGILDFDYAYMDWYGNTTQATKVIIKNSIFCDRLVITKTAEPIDIDNVGVGGMNAFNSSKAIFGYLFNGGTVNKLVLGVDVLSANYLYGMESSASYNINFTNIEIFQFGNYRSSSSYGIYFTLGANQNFDNIKVVGMSRLFDITGQNINIKNIDYCSNISGATGTRTGYIGGINGNSTGIVIDGVKIGLNGTIPYCFPYSGFIIDNGIGTKIRNIGTYNNPLDLIGYRIGQTSGSTFFEGGGDAHEGKYQRFYVNTLRGFYSATNSFSDFTLSEIKVNYPFSSSYTNSNPAITPFNTIFRGCRLNGFISTAAQVAIFGCHWADYFTGETTGCIDLLMNDTTSKTVDQVSIISGARFTNAGTCWMRTIGDEAIWEDKIFRKGHSGFSIIPPLMSGFGVDFYNTEYQIDTGSGFSGVWRTLADFVTLTTTSGSPTINDVDTINVDIDDYLWAWGSANQVKVYSKVISKNGNIITLNKNADATTTNTFFVSYLPNETIDPSIGFRLKIRIRTKGTNTNGLSNIKIFTTTTPEHQALAVYPLDTVTLTLNGIVSGSDVVVRKTGTTTILGSVDENISTSWNFVYETAEPVDISIFKPGYIPYFIKNFSLSSSNASLPITQQQDPSYIE